MYGLGIRYSFFVVACSMLFLACSDEGGSTSADDKIVVNSVDDLSNCTNAKIGNLEYVDTTAYMCVTLEGKSRWIQVSGIEDNPDNFKVCNSRKDGLYSFSSNDKTLYVCKNEEWILVDGLAGDGDIKSSSSSRENGSSGSGGSDNPRNDGDESSSSRVVQSGGSHETSSTSETSSASASDNPESSESVASSASEQSSASENPASSDGSIYNAESNTLKDLRDGQTYRTVVIAPAGSGYSKVWMAQNLNYEVGHSFCYNGTPTCPVFGRLYDWATAVGKTDAECGYSHECNLGAGTIRGICPRGWHLPSEAEWDDLSTAVGGVSVASGKLRSNTGWWNDANGTDDFGFSALPAGMRDEGSGEYYDMDRVAIFWTSTEFDDNLSVYVHMQYIDDWLSIKNAGKYGEYSIRCLKD